MPTDTTTAKGSPDGAESVTTLRKERQIIRLALKRYGNDLTRQQRADTEKGVPNAAIVETLTMINGSPNGANLPGLVKRFMLDGDTDPAAPVKEKKKDPNQLDIPVGNGGAKGDRSVARGKPSDDGIASIKDAAKRGK